jgi:uncharacterized integral membrane protein
MTSPSEPSGPADTASAPSPAGAAPPLAAAHQHRVHRTRMGGLWVGLTLAAIVLLLLLVFILENSKQASISYFGAHGHLPLGVALLLAAVAGALLVSIPGSMRILQLRKTARGHRKLDAIAAQPSPDAAVPAAGSQAPTAQQPGDQA